MAEFTWVKEPSHFAANGGNRLEKKARTIEKLTKIFERFKGLYVRQSL